LYVVRQALELVSVSRAAQYATPEEIARLQECLIEQRALIKKGIHTVEEFRAFSAKDEEFHLLMAEASQNQPLVTLLSTVLPLVMSGRLEIIERSGGFEAFIQRSVRESVCDEHASILDAISNRDTRAAEYFIYAHLQRSMATYRDLQ
jgi:DNA-binding GntR family transcriptional regulator